MYQGALLLLQSSFPHSLRPAASYYHHSVLASSSIAYYTTYSSPLRSTMSFRRPSSDCCSSWTAFFKKLINAGVTIEAGACSAGEAERIGQSVAPEYVSRSPAPPPGPPPPKTGDGGGDSVVVGSSSFKASFPGWDCSLTFFD